MYYDLCLFFEWFYGNGITNGEFTAGIYGFVPNTRDSSGERGRANFDANHNFIASYIWEIPFLKNRRDVLGAVFGGWQLSGITSRTEVADFHTDSWAVDGTYYVKPLDDGDGPYALASFLNPTTRVSAGTSPGTSPARRSRTRTTRSCPRRWRNGRSRTSSCCCRATSRSSSRSTAASSTRCARAIPATRGRWSA